MPAGQGHWEDHFAAGNGFHRADAHEIWLLGEAVRPQPGARALDVGRGLGTYAAALAGLGYRTLAVDWADAAVAATRDRCGDLAPGALRVFVLRVSGDWPRDLRCGLGGRC
ncbi:hypothetical protein GCM10022403_022510 [Streptomyces coacervatus]|uniref:Class I SAM-dependent methyltransferase n=1 Tax=Streptomyces coacervatus TaxID=647381 RepID=A0ABP7H7C9_9ACTN|nr:hypothetical protein [Streptomyces coacervatus]MDF2267719.1 hypothetical protein [Streptomyces coacervatus]